MKAPKPPITPAQRKAAERAKHRQSGLIMVTVWVPAEARDKIMAAALYLRNQK